MEISLPRMLRQELTKKFGGNVVKGMNGKQGYPIGQKEVVALTVQEIRSGKIIILQLGIQN